ncbi:uncharacterized protein BT62DRAFT_578524 [Guyanagaster necrorhizus]|uniref:Uncharacterized protein n=1 Tax=Guyanagaster necrorhizus TaxID=856835 RepID=A0A9P7VIL3_9AGAR|nr:uncharacterized protein BT62DRAFT_578524 [Guyanagaster necrorhizus MCA 3950]KAG7440624.1 hypothetical protein BT62DRAFT_578524 [Guyanagaster necrorhizus MCA 3950]
MHVAQNTIPIYKSSVYGRSLQVHGSPDKRLRATMLLFCRGISTSEPSASHKYQWRHSGFYRRFPRSLATPSSEDHQRRILSSHKSRYPRTAPKSLKVVIAALRWPPNLSPHHLSARPRALRPH